MDYSLLWDVKHKIVNKILQRFRGAVFEFLTAVK